MKNLHLDDLEIHPYYRDMASKILSYEKSKYDPKVLLIKIVF